MTRLGAWLDSRRLGALLIALLVAGLNMAAWRVFNPPLSAPPAPATVAGLAYNAFQRWDTPLRQDFPSDSALAHDMQKLAHLTSRLRIYSAAEFPALPGLAARHGLTVVQGVWLDERVDNNEREMAAAIAATRRHGNIERVLAGNETQLHGKVAPKVLYAALDRLRAELNVPVSTAEPWHVWMRQPELAAHVDFITVHLLPYWEGIPVEAAVEDALKRYIEVSNRFPDKKVMIGEIGWPSGGSSVGVAHATPALQARFVREFLARTETPSLDYFLIEAVDQPWKQATEGAVGAHWGLMDATRGAKFNFSGPVHANPYWMAQASLATVLSLWVVLPFLLTFWHMRLAGRVAFAVSVQAVATFAVLLASLPLVNYLRWHDALLMAILVPALVVMAAILLSQVFEFAELFWRGSLRRQAPLRPVLHHMEAPYVSIHLACSNEPPSMVIATIESLRALDWPGLEIIVVDNNTTDPAIWRPVRDHVDQLMRLRDANAERHDFNDRPIRFIHLPTWSGFKAGALNVALQHTDPCAAWIAVVDADYLAHPQWLRKVMGHAEDPSVSVIQSPQAHRDWGSQTLKRMMSWEYDGFFRNGMHHRHERNAIVQHGTMTVVRADTLRTVGGWDENCICEDTELGLRLLQQGTQVVYVDEVMGTGLVPDDFAAYQRQRRRWALGAMQILRKHARVLFWPRSIAPGAPDELSGQGLTLAQRYHFVAGWLPWIGDALHLLFSLAAMAWSVGVLAAPSRFGLPLALFVVPLMVFFGVRLVLVPLLYLRRVPCGARDVAGAALAGMSLSHSVARGVFAGLFKQQATFDVTRKGNDDAPVTAALPTTRRQGRWSSVREEAGLLLALVICMAALAWQHVETDGALISWLSVLTMQAVPYAAALVGAALSPSAARQAQRIHRVAQKRLAMMGSAGASPEPAMGAAAAVVAIRHQPNAALGLHSRAATFDDPAWSRPPWSANRK